MFACSWALLILMAFNVGRVWLNVRRHHTGTRSLIYVHELSGEHRAPDDDIIKTDIGTPTCGLTSGPHQRGPTVASHFIVCVCVQRALQSGAHLKMSAAAQVPHMSVGRFPPSPSSSFTRFNVNSQNATHIFFVLVCTQRQSKL